MAVVIPGYSDLTEIGRGGFAVVYRGHQQGFGRLVAVKVLARLNVDERTRRRFARECEVMGALSWHPNIVVVYDNGLTLDGQPFITMEYLADGSLVDRHRRDGGSGEADIMRWGVQVCGALQTAHDAGVLHRDLKPENVLLDVFGQAKLSDFGIAAITGANETTTGSASFTVVHAAPEIINGLPATERSDLYSLGSTLFQLLTGRAAFRRQTDESVTATLLRVVQAPVPDLRADGVSDGLAALIESMMAKDPDDRPASAVAVGEALRDLEVAAGRAPTEMRLHPDRERGTTAGVAGARGGSGEGTDAGEGAGETIEVGVTAPHRAPPESDATPPGPDGEAPAGDGRADEEVAGVAPADEETVTVRRAAEDLPVAEPLPADATSGPAADVGGRQASADRRGVAPSADAARPDESLPAAAERPGRRRTLVIAAAVVVVLVLVAVGAALLGGGDDGGRSSGATDAAAGATGGTAGTASSAPGATSSSSTSTPVATGPVGTTTSVEVGDGPRGVAVGAGAVWVANSASGSVSRVSLGGDEVEATIDTGGSPRAVTVAEGSVWVTNATEGVVARIDPATNEPVGEVEVGNGPSWVTGGEGSIWVANVFDDSVSRIDPATNEVVATITVGDAPSGIAVGGGSVVGRQFRQRDGVGDRPRHQPGRGHDRGGCGPRRHRHHRRPCVGRRLRREDGVRDRHRCRRGDPGDRHRAAHGWSDRG